MSDEDLSIWDVDGGSAARSYARSPYTHYREEIYPLIGQILDGLGDGIRVLDVGAGPGHCAAEFYRRRPDSRTRFVLLDVGEAMLDIAREQLGALRVPCAFHVRDFNDPDWHAGLGQFDAIVSNNALFHLLPDRVGAYYREAYRLLRADGVLLNHQSFGHEDPAFGAAVEHFPQALAWWRGWSDEERLRAEEARRESDELLAAAEARREKAPGGAQKGEESEGAPAYASLHLPVTEHIQHMRRAGFSAGCIWRKMESAVLAGIKGRPFTGTSENRPSGD
ncbi:MAG: class I SAM-dependent methyltransferase [Candidatus Brocadiaceae bacterium]|jgi:SAM-dependent methyltransferase